MGKEKCRVCGRFERLISAVGGILHLPLFRKHPGWFDKSHFAGFAFVLHSYMIARLATGHCCGHR